MIAKELTADYTLLKCGLLFHLTSFCPQFYTIFLYGAHGYRNLPWALHVQTVPPLFFCGYLDISCLIKVPLSLTQDSISSGTRSKTPTLPHLAATGRNAVTVL